MLSSRSLAFVLLCAAVPAQSYFIPDPSATTGNCNVIPLGGTLAGPFNNQIYQQILTPAELGNLPGIITGMGFAMCGTGRMHYATLQVVLDHSTNPVLSTTFAQNLTPNAVTVLDATDYDWNVNASSWEEIGLQRFFVYNGIDNLVVQITAIGSSTPGTGNHRDVHQRVYNIGWTGTPPATGSTDNAALKIEIDLMMAKTSSHGRGCVGSNTLTPLHTIAGTPQLGQLLSFDLANGLPGYPSLLGFGFGAHRFPFPIDLGIVGMPTCMEYFSPLTFLASANSASGTASIPLALPNNPGLLGMRVYTQWVCFDPPANTTGATVSNYMRVQVGN